VPKSVRFVDELPRNSMGKIQKSELVSGSAPSRLRGGVAQA
jgi:acyl-coenzyme A synthetase/AMP-(fatty) acid ligase